MKKVFYSDAAEQDLDDIAAWIGKHNLAAADRLLEDVDRVLALTLDFPGIGEAVDRYAPGMRRITLGSYVIYYFHVEAGLEVARVVHGARNVGKIFP